jgi:hypothetical protein
MGRDRDRADLDRWAPVQTCRAPRSSTSPNDSTLPRCSRRLRTNAAKSAALCSAPSQTARSLELRPPLARRIVRGNGSFASGTRSSPCGRQLVGSIAVAYAHEIGTIVTKSPALGRTRRRGQARRFRVIIDKVRARLVKFSSRPARVPSKPAFGRLRALHGTSRPSAEFQSRR